VAKAAVKKSATADPSLRAIPVISTQFSKLNLSGNEYQHWFIRLPKGAIADDLKEPSLFKQLQESPKALRRRDTVRLVEYNEAWIAEAMVAEANATEVVLAGVRIINSRSGLSRLLRTASSKLSGAALATWSFARAMARSCRISTRPSNWPFVLLALNTR
jgi:hypothetical protein